MPAHPRRAAAVCALSLAAATAAAASPAAAAVAARPDASSPAAVLPPIGAEVPSSILAIGSKLEYRGTTYTLDFRGGIKQRVDVNPNDPINSVRLRTIGFRVSAEDDALGDVTIEQNDVDVDARSTLTQTQLHPPRYEETDYLSFTIVLDRAGQPTVILETKKPMALKATISSFPARGDTYSLEGPVDLVDPETGRVTARLTVFNAKRGGL
jgi:hypothetical protein